KRDWSSDVCSSDLTRKTVDNASTCGSHICAVVPREPPSSTGGACGGPLTVWWRSTLIMSFFVVAVMYLCAGPTCCAGDDAIGERGGRAQMIGGFQQSRHLLAGANPFEVLGQDLEQVLAGV